MPNCQQNRNTSHPININVSPNHTKPLNTPKHTTVQGSAFQRDKSQLHSPENRHKSPQPGNLHYVLIQSHPQGQTPKLIGAMTFQPSERRPQTELIKQTAVTKTRKHEAEKDKDKNSQDQTTEEELSSLPEKQLRVIIVKMIQSLEIKVEAQTNGLEAWIQKTQEMFAKDLEALSNKQLIMNKIIEIKNKLELVMPSNHIIFCCLFLLLASNFSSIRVFSTESTLQVRQPKYWSFSFSISPSTEYSGLMSFRIDWFAVQGALKSLLQHHS